MGRYLKSLAKRGFTVSLSPSGKLLIPAGMSESLALQVMKASKEIIAELRAEPVCEAISHAVKPFLTDVNPNPHYCDKRHNYSDLIDAWVKLNAVAAVYGYIVWNWDEDEPKPEEPYCYVKPIRVNNKYLYWPNLRENNVDYFWTPAALVSLDSEA